jgi:hypothetical protein
MSLKRLLVTSLAAGVLVFIGVSVLRHFASQSPPSLPAGAELYYWYADTTGPGDNIQLESGASIPVVLLPGAEPVKLAALKGLVRCLQGETGWKVGTVPPSVEQRIHIRGRFAQESRYVFGVQESFAQFHVDDWFIQLPVTINVDEDLDTRMADHWTPKSRMARTASDVNCRPSDFQGRKIDLSSFFRLAW